MAKLNDAAKLLSVTPNAPKDTSARDPQSRKDDELALKMARSINKFPQHLQEHRTLGTQGS
jgi:hypothetical protein